MTKKQKLTKLQKEWVKALRSGRYKQTTGVLCKLDSGGYCCLGVAARVCGIPKAKIVGIHDLGDRDYLEAAKTKLRLRDGSGRLSKAHQVSPYNVYTHLTGLNDNANLSFKEIADLIEKDPENVFLPPKSRAKKA
jgi:hypothetical protein